MKALDDYRNNTARMTMGFGPRRGECFDIDDVLRTAAVPLSDDDLLAVSQIDLVYRTLCAVLYNFVPTSGHPGGSISSGRIVEGLIYGAMDYDFSFPDDDKNDAIVYAAGHKALGLYAMWALRNELVRLNDPGLLAPEKRQLRWEDLLGFRRNPTQGTPLFKKFGVKALDGHPTPGTPFVKVATGASGVGLTTAVGIAFAARDYYGKNAPKVHVIEGEGGLTPGRVSEVLASAGTAQLDNLVLHIDWNQSSIDSDAVCREGGAPGDYVQWNPLELARLHDFNVIYVRDGMSIPHIWAAQALAMSIETTQPTAIVYRTVKGWEYGIEGKKSHGAGHTFCSDDYDNCLAGGFEKEFGVHLPHYPKDMPEDVAIEKTYWATLTNIRRVLQKNRHLTRWAADRVRESMGRLQGLNRTARKKAPRIDKIYNQRSLSPVRVPKDLALAPGTKTTLRGELGKTLGRVNETSGGALIVASADLLGSTSVSKAAAGFPDGYFNAQTNAGSRTLSIGGICEDGMGGVMCGLSAFGRHMGVTSSYGAFIAAMEHVPARLHGIGEMASAHATGRKYRTMVMINGHAGAKTGEDGPTHADPQALQLLCENFPRGVLITLTPWDPAEVWPLVIAGLQKRPAVLAPFVTRPTEVVPDRKKLGIAPATEAVSGVYRLVTADPKGPRHGTLVFQGSEVGMAFAAEVLPWMKKNGVNCNVYYVASAELFSLLSDEEQEKRFPEAHRIEAMGVTGFTLPTLYRWVLSDEGRRRSLYPFRDGHFLGSGKGSQVMKEGGLDGASIIEAVDGYAKSMAKNAPKPAASLSVARDKKSAAAGSGSAGTRRARRR